MERLDKILGNMGYGSRKEVKASCKVGCIGCGICVKQCEERAISLLHNRAQIDTEKCSKCGKCKAKCPTKAINNLLEE